MPVGKYGRWVAGAGTARPRAPKYFQWHRRGSFLTKKAASQRDAAFQAQVCCCPGPDSGARYIYFRMVSVAVSGLALTVTVTFRSRGVAKESSQERNASTSCSLLLWAILQRLSMKMWEMS